MKRIFQLFFTTLPKINEVNRAGTGLGLSLSYDIIKAHGGEIKVETKEGEGLPAGEAGTTFIIRCQMSESGFEWIEKILKMNFIKSV